MRRVPRLILSLFVVLVLVWVWVYTSISVKTVTPNTPVAPVIQAQALEPVISPAPPLPPDQNVHELTKVQQELVRELMRTLLGHIDEETRYGCGENGHPRYFPRQPKLVVTYQKGGFTPDFWLELQLMAREIAPAVTLMSYKESADEVYLIDILSIKATRPLATLAYRHSKFNFGSKFASVPIFGAGQYQKPSNLARTLVTNEARIALSGDHWANTATLARGNIYLRDREEMKNHEVKDKPEILEAISEGVEKFELTLPEDERMASGFWYKKEELEVKTYDYSSLVDPNVVLVIVNTPPNFSGVVRLYLLEKQSEWRVVDTVTNTWSDHLPPRVPCTEP